MFDSLCVDNAVVVDIVVVVFACSYFFGTCFVIISETQK